MTKPDLTSEAIAECHRWFDYLRAHGQRSFEMQVAARMAREGRAAEAGEILRRIDGQPRVYDGGDLRDAVTHLIAEVERLHRALDEHRAKRCPRDCVVCDIAEGKDITP